MTHEYVKGKPFFCQFEKIKAYPYLTSDVKTDILIVGGGIVGATTNYYLSKEFDVALVDKSRFGMGCTSCATVLLEYQLDDYAEELLDEMSEEEIVQVYKMGQSSIAKIEDFIKEHGNFCHFSKRPSMLYTNNIFNIGAIKKEYDFRIKHGFSAKYFDSENNPFSFSFKAGLYCEDGGAEFNPYLFAKQMIENSQNQDKLFENTEIVSIQKIDDGFVATTNFQERIFCKRVIFAIGYNFELFPSPALCTRKISYTIVTNPLPELKIENNALLQNDKSPYHYMRLLPDNRIIFGGEDTTYKGSISPSLSQRKYRKLEKELKKIFPAFAENIQVEYEFCGAFGETENNLGLIGTSENPDILFMLSCGANGVINAMYGAQLLISKLKNQDTLLADQFSPLR